MKKLVLTVGLPQSGKSTWAQLTTYPVVNPDAIRLALHGKPFIGLAEPFVWAIAKVMVRSLFHAGHQKVILDATNTTRKRRDDWRSSEWQRVYQSFDTNKDTCIKRAKKTAVNKEHEKGLIVAIERMAEQFEPIQQEEVDEENSMR